MAKSLQSFLAWARATGTVGNPTPVLSSQYPGQCVSLVQQYLDQVFGIPYAPRGNAKDFVPPTFVRVSGGYQPGDIIRYGSNYGYGYGHIGIINDDGTFTDQNGVKALAVGDRGTPWNAIESIWRPTLQFSVKDAPAPSGALVSKKGTATVIVDSLNVRNAPSTSAPVVASYVNGQKFNYDSYQIANGYVWLSYVSFSGERRFVAEGPYDGNSDNVWVSGGVG